MPETTQTVTRRLITCPGCHGNGSNGGSLWHDCCACCGGDGVVEWLTAEEAEQRVYEALVSSCEREPNW